MAALTAAPMSSTFEPTPTSTPNLPIYSGRPADKYRGAVVEDLQLPPAFSLPENEAVARAIELAYDRDFTHIPVLSSKGRRPLGYIDVPTLKAKWEGGEVNPTDPVSVAMTKFERSSSHRYTLITPSTPLGELEAFLKVNIFALGEAYFKCSGGEFLNNPCPESVTDYDRQFVLAVATSSDLENFVSRRGL